MKNGDAIHQRQDPQYSSDEQYVVPDITVEWLYKPHTILAFGVLVSILGYFALTVDADASSTVFNTKIGLGVAASFLLILGLLVFPSGPFIRPHPLVWKLAFGIGVLYEIVLIFLLFQSKADARAFFQYYDPKLGVKLPERTYADDCELNWSTLSNAMDIFMLSHFLGWMVKALVLRDEVMMWSMSITWELIELAFMHMLPNFAECWWDQWILDVLICNGLGIFVGIRLCQYLEVKSYQWTGFYDLPTMVGKVQRLAMQFTPQSWMKVRWESTKNLKRFLTMNILFWIFQLQELNSFFLKHVLWIPPPCPLNVYRLGVWFFIGVPSVRQIYRYITDENCKRIGHQTFLSLVIISTELLLILKFSHDEFHTPMTETVKAGVIAFFVLYALFLLAMCFRISFFKEKNDKESEKLKMK